MMKEMEVSRIYLHYMSSFYELCCKEHTKLPMNKTLYQLNSHDLFGVKLVLNVSGLMEHKGVVI